MYENYFYLKQGSDYVTATEFVSAPIFKSIDPSISRNYVFFFTKVICQLAKVMKFCNERKTLKNKTVTYHVIFMLQEK